MRTIEEEIRSNEAIVVVHSKNKNNNNNNNNNKNNNDLGLMILPESGVVGTTKDDEMEVYMKR